MSDDRSSYHVRGKGYGLPQVWDGDTCVTDRVFNGYAEKIVEALQAIRDKSTTHPQPDMMLPAVST